MSPLRRPPALPFALVATALAIFAPPPADARQKKKDVANDEPLTMSKAVFCKEVRGFRDYDLLTDGALTKDDKLLLYCEPSGFAIKPDKDKGYRAHIASDGRVRRKGKKEILFEKKNLLDYAVAAKFPPKLIYIQTFIQIKGLGPGDYELDIVVRDILAGEKSTTQTIPFKVVAAKSADKPAEKASEKASK